MVDFRHADFVWDRPTKLFKFIGRYLRQNKDISKHSEATPVEKDGELGVLVHKMFGTSYHSGRPKMSYATVTVGEYGLQLVKANNGKQSAVYANQWRIDLGSISQEIARTFGDIKSDFTSSELDGEREVAEAFVWVGYDRFASGSYDFLRNNLLPDSDQPNLRLKGDDIALVVEASKVEGAKLQAKYLSHESGPYGEGHLILKDTLGLPVTFADRFRNNDGWAQFGPYSLIKVNGQPAAVRESILRVLAICSNETEEGMRRGNLEPLEVGLEHKISSQHLAYHQSVPQPAWGLFECSPK